MRRFTTASMAQSPPSRLAWGQLSTVAMTMHASQHFKTFFLATGDLLRPRSWPPRARAALPFPAGPFLLGARESLAARRPAAELLARPPPPVPAPPATDVRGRTARGCRSPLLLFLNIFTHQQCQQRMQARGGQDLSKGAGGRLQKRLSLIHI